VRPSRGWQACGWLLVSLSLIGIGVIGGCQKAGGGGEQGEQPPSSTPPATTPPSTTPPPSTPPTSPPAANPVVGITLAAGQTSLLADGSSSTTITATLITSTGTAAADGTAVTFSTDKGFFSTGGAKTLTASTSGGAGTVIVPFVSEAGVSGTATIIATAQQIVQSLTIEFIAPAPPPTPITQVAGITLSAGATSLVANGTSSTLITATLITSTGTAAADGITVTFTTDLGRFTTDGAKTATATTSQGTGTVLVPFISEKDIVGTATIVANVGGVAQSLQIALTGAGEPDTILLTADSTTISIFGTTGITAQVLDANGNPVTDGTAVFFTTSLAGTGVTPSSTTVDGLVTTIFSAGTQSGVATVIASAGAASASVSITIEAGPAGSLEFVSAVPTVIGVLGSALPQKSTITFRVRDVNGNPVTDGTLVTFTLISGVGGGETLEPTQVGTTAGVASTVLTSGTVSGPVRVQASVTVNGVTLTSTSTNVSIAGGSPSGAHLGVFPRFRNVAGLVTDGLICPVGATVGDRFGNPVPAGTAVSFFANGGIISPQGVTDERGNADQDGNGDIVAIKTANPTPHVGTVTNFADPRTGIVTIIAVTQGEETFIDSNGNGLFDGPQEFDPSDPELDTPEPFVDHVTLCNGVSSPCPADPVNPPVLSGNNQFDTTDRFELFIDGNSNSKWDGPNGVWDADKPIFASTRVLFSGPTRLNIGRLQFDGSCCLPSQTCVGVNTTRCDGTPITDLTGNPGGFCVPNGGTADRGPFCFIASDPAGRPLVGGTNIIVTTTNGTISGSSNIILPDTQEGGPGITLFSFTVSDDDPTDTDPPSSALVTINISSPITSQCPGGNGTLSGSFGGSAD
jgi:hypothetical protein